MRKNKKRIKKIRLIITIIIILLILFFISKGTFVIIRKQLNVSYETSEASGTTTGESTYYYVESSDGIQVPVPVGYTASEIEGETGVSTGFVIYEGDIDWSEIIVDETDASSASLDISNESVDEEIATTSLDDTSSETSEEESNSTSSDISEDDEENSNVAEASSSDIENSTQDTDNVEESSDVEETDVIDTSDETSEEETSDSETSNGENEIESDFISDDETDNIENATVSESEDGATSTDTEETDDIIYSLESEEEDVATISESDLAVVDTEDYYLSEYYSEETASNIWDLQASTNQYVWIPIDEEELEKIYGVDSNGKYWGKLYTAYSTATNWSETNGLISITSVTGYREPDVTKYRTAYDEDSKLVSYLNGSTRYELLTQELEESFYETIESIRKYGGFYIGRYETGNLSSTTAVVQKANSSISSVTWYTMYEKCKGLAGENSNVTTSMIWGSLWDATLRWLYESGATTSDGTTLTTGLIWSNSTTWGNYYNATFDYYATYNTTSTKSSSSSTKIGTGKAEYTKVNNIYDMAGNVFEWTLEAYTTGCRVYRGGHYYGYGSSYPAGGRNVNYYPTNSISFLRLSSFTLY